MTIRICDHGAMPTKTWRRNMLAAILCGALAFPAGACCTCYKSLFGKDQAWRDRKAFDPEGELDWPCFVVGNLVLYGGAVGMIVDWFTTAGWKQVRAEERERQRDREE